MRCAGSPLQPSSGLDQGRGTALLALIAARRKLKVRGSASRRLGMTQISFWQLGSLTVDLRARVRCWSSANLQNAYA
jgi:hypothetical protein